jgi:ketosteroid isomerase-like protein
MTGFQHIEQAVVSAAQPLPPESAVNTDLADALKRAYCSLATGNTAELAPLYSEDVYFEDPSHGIQGKAALVERFQHLYRNVDSCNFKFHQTLDTGGEIFLAWTMILRQRGPKSGEVIRVEGASFLKVRNNRIYYHRDYFDLGAFIYENVPMLGSIIKRIKQRLAS